MITLGGKEPLFTAKQSKLNFLMIWRIWEARGQICKIKWSMEMCLLSSYVEPFGIQTSKGIVISCLQTEFNWDLAWHKKCAYVIETWPWISTQLMDICSLSSHHLPRSTSEIRYSGITADEGDQVGPSCLQSFQYQNLGVLGCWSVTLEFLRQSSYLQPVDAENVRWRQESLASQLRVSARS